ncbi:MAG TPA: hypothetical protein VGK32_11105 [Vicinamibacterales bacterium]|jgi:hypothetical protein
MTRRSFLLAFSALGAPIVAGSASARQRGASPKVAADGRVLVLRSIGGIPPEIVGNFRDPLAFQQAASGQFFVFDRQGHTVYGIDREMSGSWPVVRIGGEAGRILEPTAFALAPNGTFVVADRPGALERIQVFGSGGALLGGFTLPGRAVATVTLGGVVFNGIGSLQYGGRSVFLSQPESGALVAEYALNGAVQRTFGVPRATGHEADRDLHCALNTGLPLLNPRGGFYFVFQGGRPLFRKLDDAGNVVFERHIEGPEIDAVINNLPTTWPRRKVAGVDRELPMVRPVVRAAAVDRLGRLWIVFASVPYLHVYDVNGEKVRVVQLQATGVLTPTGLFFAPDGHLLVTPGCYIFDPRPA